MFPYGSKDDIIQNLIDAGCDQETIKLFMDGLHNGKQSKGFKVLEKHRRALLEDLHQGQKRIDCLDYLLYMMQSQKKQGG